MAALALSHLEVSVKIIDRRCVYTRNYPNAKTADRDPLFCAAAFQARPPVRETASSHGCQRCGMPSG